MPLLQHPPGKLSCIDFGAQLLETRDLDPVYVLLHEARLEEEDLLRWLLSYWCFYHMGTASYCVDGWRGALLGETYWVRMLRAAGSKEFPRCHERRHFRAKFAEESVRKLMTTGVNKLFTPLVGKDLSLQEVFTVVTGWYGFGNWIAFKVADMLERLGLSRVEFSTGSIFMFDSPRKGAKLFCDVEVPINKRTTSHECDLAIQEWAVNKITTDLREYKAPPRYERPINSQEAETILCKWKSYMGGHYKIGEDIVSCKSGLERFPYSKVSKHLLETGRKTKLWT